MCPEPRLQVVEELSRALLLLSSRYDLALAEGGARCAGQQEQLLGPVGVPVPLFCSLGLPSLHLSLRAPSATLLPHKLRAPHGNARMHAPRWLIMAGQRNRSRLWRSRCFPTLPLCHRYPGIYRLLAHPAPDVRSMVHPIVKVPDTLIPFWY